MRCWVSVLIVKRNNVIFRQSLNFLFRFWPMRTKLLLTHLVFGARRNLWEENTMGFIG